MTYVDFQPAQPHALRQFNRKYKEIENRAVKSNNNADITIKELMTQFAQRTTIHGINRLCSEAVSKYERCVWLLAFIGALCGSFYVGHILSHRFTEARVQTVVDNTRLPVFNIVFPTITICNVNRLNWSRLHEAKQRFLRVDESEKTVELFERIMGLYDNIAFANFKQFAELNSEPLEQLSHVNFSEVYKFMSWRCEELLTKCQWRGFDVDCCKVFSLRRSKMGLCWAFNSLETAEGLEMQRNDKYWPWHTGGSGPKSGLLLKAMINSENHFPYSRRGKGLFVMATEPQVWHRDPFYVPENTHTKIEMEPVIYFYDNETRTLSLDQRGCIFEGEDFRGKYRTLQGLTYMIENCYSQCHQEYLLRFCNCTMDLLFPPAQYRSCQITDLVCLAKHNEIFSFSHLPGEKEFVRNHFEGMECKCLRNCYSLNYDADMRPSYLPSQVRNNLSYVELDVYFRFDTFIVYRTSLIFSWVDLLVAFGGIAGLFLGCSLISTIELVYFAVIELPFYFFMQLKKRLITKYYYKTAAAPAPPPARSPVPVLLPSKRVLRHSKDFVIQVKSTQEFYPYKEASWQQSLFPITRHNLKNVNKI